MDGNLYMKRRTLIQILIDDESKAEQECNTCVNRNLNFGVGKDSEQRAGREMDYRSNISTIITSDRTLRIMGVADQSQSPSYSPLRTEDTIRQSSSS